MTPTTRAKSAKAGSKDPDLKQTIKCKWYINTRGDDSKNTKRRSHCGASVRSEDTDATLLDTANGATNGSAGPLDSIELVDPWEVVGVPSPVALPEWNGRRRRRGLPTKDELEVADFLVTEDFRSRWVSASVSDDVLVAAVTMKQLKKDPNYSAPLQKLSCPNCNRIRRGPRS